MGDVSLKSPLEEKLDAQPQCGLKVTSSSHLPGKLQAVDSILPEVMPFLGQPRKPASNQARWGNKGLALLPYLGWAALALELPVNLVKVLPSLHPKPTSLSVQSHFFPITFTGVDFY